MNGNPLKELLLILTLIALLVPGVVKLTGRSQAAAPQQAAAGPPQQGVPTEVRLQFAHPPRKARLMHRGESVLAIKARGAETSFELELPLDLSERMLEMPFTAEWPEGTPRTAVTVRFQPQGMEAREVTFWSEGGLDEFIELHWDD